MEALNTGTTTLAGRYVNLDFAQGKPAAIKAKATNTPPSNTLYFRCETEESDVREALSQYEEKIVAIRSCTPHPSSFA